MNDAVDCLRLALSAQRVLINLLALKPGDAAVGVSVGMTPIGV
jgi:hypothetical protein